MKPNALVVGLTLLLSSPLESTSPPNGTVHALFNPDHPKTAPFPTDIFTVVDHTHNTGRRVNLPYPDCAIRVSDCDDLDVINTLGRLRLAAAALDSIRWAD